MMKNDTIERLETKIQSLKDKILRLGEERLEIEEERLEKSAILGQWEYTLQGFQLQRQTNNILFLNMELVATDSFMNHMQNKESIGTWTERSADRWRSNTIYIENYNHELNVCGLSNGTFYVERIPLALVLEMRKDLFISENE